MSIVSLFYLLLLIGFVFPCQLWFPLRALLTQTFGVQTDEDLSIIKRYATMHMFLILLPTCVHVSNFNLVHTFSVEEFVQTSNLGEFKRRLHLLLAFHGEISSGVCVGAYLR